MRGMRLLWIIALHRFGERHEEVCKTIGLYHSGEAIKKENRCIF